MDPEEKSEKTPPKGDMTVVTQAEDKHGIYGEAFFSTEAVRLDKGMLGKLDDEVFLMRALILRTAMYFKQNPEMNLEEQLASLRGITHAVARVESICRTRKAAFDDESTLEKAMEELKYLEFEQD